MKKILIFFLFTFFFLGTGPFVDAADGVFRYSVKPILPKNQSKDYSSYYRLYTSPGNIEKISFLVANESSNPITLDISPTNALTSPTGGIQYLTQKNSPNSWITDDSFYLKDQIDIQKSIYLKASERKIVSFSVKTPNVKKGEVVGAISFKERKEKVQPKKGISIQSEYAFILGIVLELSNDKTYDFNMTKAEFPTRKTNPNLEIEMENPNPNILENVKGTYRIVNKKEKIEETYFFGNFNMAPKTKIEYPTDVDPTKLPAGSYDLFIEYEINGKKLNKSLTFTLNKKKIENSISTETIATDNKKNNDKKSNKKEAFYKKTSFWAISASVLFVLLLFVILLLFKRRKKDS